MNLRGLAVEVASRIQLGSPPVHPGYSFHLLRSISAGRKRSIEALWRDFFLNTSQWWDHRPEKVNPRFPDFKHRQTQESLWLADSRNPAWVQAELAAIPPGTLQADVFVWAQRLKRYVKTGQYVRAIEVFHQMQEEGICPNGRTFLPVLNACAGLGALEEGKHVHTQIIQVGCESDVYVGSCLVDMYAKCGSIEDAWIVFSMMEEHDVVTWNAMIGGYVKSGQSLKAMAIFKTMCQEGVEPDTGTFVGLLNACASIVALEEGRRVHEEIIQRGCECDVYVANCLVDMYAKCGSIKDAWNVFNEMKEHDLVAWNAMIGAYVKSEQGLKAMELFWKMQQEGVEPDTITFIQVLKACCGVSTLREGRHVHEQIVRRGYESDVYVANSLVDMYAKCGSMDDAWTVFNKMGNHDVVTWSVMIGGYVRSGQGLKAMELFWKMQQEGVEPDTVTFVRMLNACASVGALEEGKTVHKHIVRRGSESNVYVATCLVDMYAKCGSIEDAWGVFKKMPEHNVVTWGAMIGGSLKSGQGLKAIELYKKMQQQGVEPDRVIFVGVLNACASVAALEVGRQIHEQIIQRGLQSDVYVSSCLVDMYAKCGSIEDAQGVFIKMPTRDVVAWTAMIGGFAMHGHAKEAIELFEQMCKAGIGANEITFACLLSACSHGGFLKEGLHYFKSMSSHFNICPIAEHYACMVDLLGRAGRLEEAEELVKSMPLEADVHVWLSLLGACSIHGNIEMAMRAAKQCWELDPENVSGHIILSNIYAVGRKWDKSAASGEGVLERKC